MNREICLPEPAEEVNEAVQNVGDNEKIMKQKNNIYKIKLKNNDLIINFT